MKSSSEDSDNQPGLRQKAEKILSGRKTRIGKPKTGDLQRLIHELEVHQIELELQNEELIEAQASMDSALVKYINLYDFAPVGYITLSRDGTILDANLVTSKYLGAERSILIHKRLGVFVTGESLPIFNHFLEQLGTGEGEKSCELALVDQKSGKKWVQLEGTSFEDSDRSRITLTDITQRKQAEHNIAQRVKELQLLYESGLALSQLLDPQEIGTKITDLLGHRMNWHCIEIRLYDPEKNELRVLSARHSSRTGENITTELVENSDKTVSKPGQGLSGLAFQNSQAIRIGSLEEEPNYIAGFEGMHSGIYIPIKAGEKPIGVISVESRQPNAFSEDDERLISTIASQAAIDFENARLFQTANKEIEERKRVERLLAEEKDQLTYRVNERTADLLRINKELEHAIQAKNEFLTSMSHELRTPLNAILGLSESLQLNTYGPLEEKQIKAIGTIEESGKHLLKLINDILDLSKINAGMLEISPIPVSLKDICISSLNLTQGMSGKKKQRVSFSFPEQPVMVNADARRLMQALINLLSNAIKFTEIGGELGLEVQLVEIDQQVKITVWDKGIGIQPEDMPKLFKVFTQIDARLNRQYEGTGLGLSLAKGIVELHQGNIQVTSVIGGGSRFSVMLPVLNVKANVLG